MISNLNKRKAIIFGVKGIKLTPEEKRFLSSAKPWGIILFKRNIISFKQTKNLTKKIRSCMKDPFYPILIDEEGGRVSRLKKIVDNSIFPGKFLFNGCGCSILLVKYADSAIEGS